MLVCRWSMERSLPQMPPRRVVTRTHSSAGSGGSETSVNCSGENRPHSDRRLKTPESLVAANRGMVGLKSRARIGAQDFATAAREACTRSATPALRTSAPGG